jgi:integrase
MAIRITDEEAKGAGKPDSGNRITYDDEIKGFGLRVTSAGAKAFILNYRAGGRERRITIGAYPDWSVSAARKYAKEMKRQIDVGEDPMADRHADRAAPTIDDLADRFVKEHLAKRRDSTAQSYQTILRLYIRPALGKARVADLRHSDVEKLHRDIAKTMPYQANRAVAVLSKMLSLAVKWEMRDDNPVKGIERAPEEKRERFLSPAEIARLAEVLATHKEKASCNAIRLLLLTGARKNEVLSARWAEFDLAAGVWVKPSAHTKQKKEHRIPLSAPARVLLAEIRAEADKEAKRGGKAEFVFPGLDDQPITTIKRTWLSVCKAAGLAVLAEKIDAKGKPVKNTKGEPVMVWQATARIHDLRHTYASILASSGLSLPIIGALLGHTQTATTARYAHLLDDPLRAATERVGVVVAAGSRPAAEVVGMADRRAAK